MSVQSLVVSMVFISFLDGVDIRTNNVSTRETAGK